MLDSRRGNKKLNLVASYCIFSYLKLMDNQGKRPDQIKFSEDATFWALIGLVIVLLYTIVI